MLKSNNPVPMNERLWNDPNPVRIIKPAPSEDEKNRADSISFEKKNNPIAR